MYCSIENIVHCELVLLTRYFENTVVNVSYCKLWLNPWKYIWRSSFVVKLSLYTVQSITRLLFVYCSLGFSDQDTIGSFSYAIQKPFSSKTCIIYQLFLPITSNNYSSKDKNNYRCLVQWGLQMPITNTTGQEKLL